MARLYIGDNPVKGVGVGSSYVSLVTARKVTGFNLTITSGTTAIANSAFHDISIPILTIPASVTSIGARAFYFCNIKKVYFAGNPPTLADNSTIFGGNRDVKMYHKANNTNWTAAIKTDSYGGARNVTWGTY